MLAVRVLRSSSVKALQLSTVNATIDIVDTGLIHAVPLYCFRRRFFSHWSVNLHLEAALMTAYYWIIKDRDAKKLPYKSRLRRESLERSLDRLLALR